MDCGKYIKAARIAAGLTQAELAAKCDMATITIRQYESGKRQPRYEQLECLADVLDVPVEVLLGIGESARVESAAIAADVIEGAGLTLVGKDGKVIHQGDRKLWQKLSTEEAYRLGILNLAFNSEEDRIAYFYSLLNTDGKLAASKYFYQNLDKDRIREVADYVENLSEIPQYQAITAPESTPAPQEGKR